jgi:hypothetical protein
LKESARSLSTCSSRPLPTAVIATPFLDLPVSFVARTPRDRNHKAFFPQA